VRDRPSQALLRLATHAAVDRPPGLRNSLRNAQEPAERQGRLSSRGTAQIPGPPATARILPAELSIIIPTRDERGNVEPLFDRLQTRLALAHRLHFLRRSLQRWQGGECWLGHIHLQLGQDVAAGGSC